MAKKFEKIFALAMVLCMLISMMPMQTLAEETETFEVEGVEGTLTHDEGTKHIVIEFAPAEPSEPTEPSEPSGSDEPQNPNTVVVEDASGTLEWDSELTLGDEIDLEVTDVTVTETLEGEDTVIYEESATVESEGVNEEGNQVEGEETYVQTTTTTSEYVQVEEVIEGSETVTEERDVLEGTDGVTVDVPLTDEDDPSTEDVIENTDTVVVGDPVGTVIETEGEKPENLGEGEYDYSETTVVEQGSVTITTEEITIEETVGAEGTDLDYVRSDVAPDADNDLHVATSNYDSTHGESTWQYVGENQVDPDSIETVEGYDYVLLESGNSSQFYAARLFKSPDPDNDDPEKPAYVAPDGTKYYTHRGNNLGTWYNMEGVYLNGEKVSDETYKSVWANVGQYVLVDGDTGELISTYCADIDTTPENGFGYNIQNVEDATYYSEEQAAMIRTVALNGYWGVSDDESTEEAETGSLEAVKAMMRDAKDEDGNAVFTDEEINLLSDGAAMTATQYAIWTFSNHMSDVAFLNVHYIPKDDDMIGNIKWGYNGLKDVPADEQPTVDLIFKLYDYMINMEPEKIEKPTTANTIINAENFVEDVQVTVVEKVAAEDHANNRDDDDKNDAYVTNLSFVLVVEPSDENGDNLVVKLFGADLTQPLAVGRVAGELQEGEVRLDCDENKNYTFRDIVMTEGDQNFKLTLDGIQHLSEGVYLYSSEIREDEDGEDVSSQTMVGMAGGDRAVSVEMNIRFDLNVEDRVVATERVWRSESDPVVNRIPPEDNDPPVRYRMGRGIGQLETIIDEEVPLAEVPQTGDSSIVWFALIVLSVCGMCILNLSDKKCRAEA